MAYLGNNLQAAYSSYLLIDSLSASFNGTTTSFALKVNGVAPVPFPLNEQNVLISVGGVPQKPDPTGAEGFKFSGTNIVFSSAPKTGEAFWGVVLAGADYVNVGVSYPDGAAATPSITFNSNKTTGIYLSGVSTLGFTTAGVLRSTIDSNGNLSILSAGSATIPAVAVGTGTTYAPGIYSPGTDQVALSTNGVVRLTTSTTAVSSALAIDHPLGAAGTPSITFTGDLNTGIYSPGADQVAISTNGTGRLFVDASGRLLVGTSSSRASANGVEAGVQVEGIGAAGALSIIRNGGLSYLTLGRSGSSTIGSNTIISNGDELGRISWAAADGTDIQSWAAQISAEIDGTPGSNDTPGRLVFSTTADGAASPTERMRITNAGKILLNATSTTYAAPTFGTRGEIEQTIATYNNGDVFVRFCSGTQGSASLRGYIETNGVSVLYSTASDARLKENIADAPEAGSTVDAVQVRSFDWKESGIHQEYGFVAQELLEVYPHAVSQPSSDDEERPLAVDYSQLVPLLVKEVQALRVRVAALEAT
jgi:hypothetical protein